jgi:Natural resistance-associated macrophage protein-like
MTLLLVVPVLYVNQEMVLRLGAVTGVGHARLILERFGKFWGAFSVIDLFILNALTILTEFIGITLAAGYLGLPKAAAVGLAAMVIIGAAAIMGFTGRGTAAVRHGVLADAVQRRGGARPVGQRVQDQHVHRRGRGRPGRPVGHPHRIGAVPGDHLRADPGHPGRLRRRLAARRRLRRGPAARPACRHCGSTSPQR